MLNSNRWQEFFFSKANIAAMRTSAIILLLNTLLIFLPMTNAFRFWEVMTLVGYGSTYYYYQYYRPRKMAEKGIVEREDFWQELVVLTKRYQKKLPPQPRQKLEKICALCEQLAEIYPQLHYEQQYTIKHMIIDYIPTTLNHYLRLPKVIRTGESEIAQKAATRLEQQLQLLEDALLTIIQQAAEVGLKNLTLNTHFLQQRFGIKPFPEN